MTCDRCDGPSCGPRCPACVRIHGDAPVVTRVVAVEPATQTQRRNDSAHGWEAEGS